MSVKHNKLSLEQVSSLLENHYGIKGQLTKLPGELDLNYKISVNTEENYILKVSQQGTSLDYLEFQTDLLVYLNKKAKELLTPEPIKNKTEGLITTITDSQGNQRNMRVLSWISGRIWSKVNPHSDTLRYGLGYYCGKLTKTLQGFKHPQLHREFEWDIAQSGWTMKYLSLFSKQEKELLEFFLNRFNSSFKSYNKLRKTAVHNDANDNNIIVSEHLPEPEVKSLIDYGDTIYTQLINDVAICCAYTITDYNDPLEASLPIIKGYHKAIGLQEKELEHLYNCIAIRLVISVTKSAINEQREPENKYLTISEKPAWELLNKWKNISSEFAYCSFRYACGYDPHPGEQRFKNWASSQRISLKSLFPSIGSNKIEALDLSISSTWIGHEKDFNDPELFTFKIQRLQKEHPNHIIAGGYLEPRPIYSASSYDRIGNKGSESRSVHLGVDFWLPSGTAVHAIFDGEVVIAVNDAGDKEYGGLLVLKHIENNIVFYSLYGHLTVASATQHKKGDLIKKGSQLASLGDYPENGNWAPHLHFQLIHTLLEQEGDFPGVAYPDQKEIWGSICPDPNLLFKNNTLNPPTKQSRDAIISYRKKHLGKSLSLQYKNPIHVVRGSGVHLMDNMGRKYLDTVNNVAHVGHEHPLVVTTGQEQMALLNTNSRYLHKNINALAKELLKTLPPSLSVLHFVNSGSEANELALRMAMAATGQKDVIASESGYHGNSNKCIEISSYKFDGKGGQGAPEHTHIFPLPDSFRGKFRGKDSGEEYAKEVLHCITNVHKKKRGVCAFIIEPIISCGGQIELPEGFLKDAYKYIQQAGGVCISDEVQTGCGRVGKTFWGFELHDVNPDIVTIGKPLGNGHPVAAVACTSEIASAFANGMEYFNTFGGNPVSCAIATQVLRIIDKQGLQQHAVEVGNYLKNQLEQLKTPFPIIADVRGQGLFLGIEFTDKNLNPLRDKADYMINRMKDHKILMSPDGPDGNVIKIKPPMIFSIENANELIFYFRKILHEDFMQLN